MSNLAQRVLFAAIALPLCLTLVVLGGWFYWALVLGLALLCWWEFCTMLGRRGFYTRATLAGYVWIILVFCRAPMHSFRWLNTDLLVLALIFFLCVYELGLKNIPVSVNRLSAQMFGALYVGFATYALYLLGTLRGQGWKIVVPFLCAVWLSDTLAYFFGRFAGKHLLYPAISPKKTVEGGIGAIAGAVIGFASYLVWNNMNPVQVLALGMIIGVAGQVGDFTESLIKRWADVKDSSALFPGHGGVLDRIDSILFAAPVALFYLRYVV